MGGSFFLPGSGGFGSSQKGALRSCPWADNRTVQGRRPPHEATFPLSSSVSRSAVSVDVIEHRQQLGTPVMRRAGASGKRRPRTHAPSQKNVCTSLPREPDGSVDRSHPPLLSLRRCRPRLEKNWIRAAQPVAMAVCPTATVSGADDPASPRGAGTGIATPTCEIVGTEKTAGANSAPAVSHDPFGYRVSVLLR